MDDVISFVKAAQKLKYLDLLGNPLTKDLYPEEFVNRKTKSDMSTSSKAGSKSESEKPDYDSISLFNQKYELNSQEMSFASTPRHSIRRRKTDGNAKLSRSAFKL